jgi:cysteine synthase A
MPTYYSVERQRLLARYGAEIHSTPAIRGHDGAVFAAQEMLREHAGYFMPSQFENPPNPDVHRRTTRARDSRGHRRPRGRHSWPAIAPAAL